MEQVTLKDVLDVVVDMKQDMKQMREDMNKGFSEVNDRIDRVEKEQQEMKKEQQEMKQDIIGIKQEQQNMRNDIIRNFNEVKETQRKILQLEADVIVETKWIVKRIGENGKRITALEERDKNIKKTKGKIIEFKGNNEEL